jgi:hypothetical protein
MDFTREQKIKALKRELGLRMSVYPKRVALNQMHEQEAAYQIGVIKAIIDDYEKELSSSQMNLDLR